MTPVQDILIHLTLHIKLVQINVIFHSNTSYFLNLLHELKNLNSKNSVGFKIYQCDMSIP